MFQVISATSNHNRKNFSMFLHYQNLIFINNCLIYNIKIVLFYTKTYPLQRLGHMRFTPNMLKNATMTESSGFWLDSRLLLTPLK